MVSPRAASTPTALPFVSTLGPLKKGNVGRGWVPSLLLVVTFDSEAEIFHPLSEPFIVGIPAVTGCGRADVIYCLIERLVQTSYKVVKFFLCDRVGDIYLHIL